MATKKKAISLDDEEEGGSSSITRDFPHPEQPPKKKGKKRHPGMKKHCIMNHRLLSNQFHASSFGNKHTEADECKRLEHDCRTDQLKLVVFDNLFASVYRVAKHIGGPAPLIALSIMPYLMHKGETAGGYAYAESTHELQEWIDDIPFFDEEERVLIEMYKNFRCEEEPGYYNWLRKARFDAYDLHGCVPAWMEDEMPWVSCDEEYSDCEFADYDE